MAAWLRGRVSAFDDMAAGDPSWKPGAQPIGQRTGELAAAEIERLCAELKLGDNKVLVYRGSKPMSECVVTEQSVLTQASRDAAALDEIRLAMRIDPEPRGGFVFMTAKPASDVIGAIIERTGRKIGA